MLQDAIWADETRLSDPAYCGQAVAFVKASLEGWAYCRDNAQSCADIVVAKGSKLGATHQLWQMNESQQAHLAGRRRRRCHRHRCLGPHGGDRQRHHEPRRQDGAHQGPRCRRRGRTTSSTKPSSSSPTDGVDVNGASFAPIDVTLTEGGA